MGPLVRELIARTGRKRVPVVVTCLGPGIQYSSVLQVAEMSRLGAGC